jgi:cysteinyl-tRNA synthetase
MDDDLNLPEAMGAVFTLIRTLNRELDSATNVGEATHAALVMLLDEVDDVLGVRDLVARERGDAALEPALQELLDLRASARANREWVESDRLRDELAAAGVAVEDTAQGQRWRRT